ncbi:hypothetical protein CCR94_10285 [Rhodoblastus sphagnicola]|uniref:Uncharacterized protein n=1 Tax=Rhodoblastus sphagnicola TaxID=333368 RepID=A0A2S6N915_9HYPH|nr:hypothetical protein [Rhodoblastus sphagnicola]MBB4196878.1 hypothetical protein [Rhodoblastus sphagnicola]PPQ31100.1 hypothetical protein CCR94_10285 [Rhodoblastus sphagnicola]
MRTAELSDSRIFSVSRREHNLEWQRKPVSRAGARNKRNSTTGVFSSRTNRLKLLGAGDALFGRDADFLS